MRRLVQMRIWRPSCLNPLTPTTLRVLVAGHLTWQPTSAAISQVVAATQDKTQDSSRLVQEPRTATRRGRDGQDGDIEQGCLSQKTRPLTTLLAGLRPEAEGVCVLD
jgi:hypothetical protein